MRKNRALFAISNLGLGHATRTLAVINVYLSKNYEIDIISYGNALKYLKEELELEKVNYIELQDYPALERGTSILHYIYLITDILKTHFIIVKEHKYVKEIEKKYDFIFSDGRYGVYSKNIPSFLLSHQLSFAMPKLFIFYKAMVDYFNKKHFKNFRLVFIPDYTNKKNSLAGSLSHPKRINSINHKYIGILSSFNYSEYELDRKSKIDFLFIISGYLFENKQNFVDKLILQSKYLSGKKVFVLGDTSSYYVKELENDITIYSYVSGEIRKTFFKNAEVIISRSGYTTIMDCVEMDKKAIFFPTRNQTEQEYLSKYLSNNNYFVIGNDNSNLVNLISNIKNITEFKAVTKTKDALEIIVNEIEKFL